MKRLQNRDLDENRLERHRHIHEPEILATEQDDEDEPQAEDELETSKGNRRWESSEEDEEAEEVNEDDIERRRFVARQKALIKLQEEVITSNISNLKS